MWWDKVPGQRRPAPPLIELQARIAVINLHPETLSLQSALSFGKQQHLDTSSLKFLTSRRCSSRRARNGTMGPTAWSREGREKHSRWQGVRMRGSGGPGARMNSWAPEIEANWGAGQWCQDLWEGSGSLLLSGVRGTEPMVSAERHAWHGMHVACMARLDLQAPTLLGPPFPTCNMASPQRLVHQLAGELNSQDVKAVASPPGGPSSLCPSDKTAVS